MLFLLKVMPTMQTLYELAKVVYVVPGGCRFWLGRTVAPTHGTLPVPPSTPPPTCTNTHFALHNECYAQLVPDLPFQSFARPIDTPPFATPAPLYSRLSGVRSP